MSYDIGGGGGKAGGDTSDQNVHDLPFELGSTYNADELNELLRILFKALTRIEADTGAGDVTGPTSATDGNVAIFDGTTGKKIRDSGSAIADLATASSSLQSSTVQLTNAQIQDLEATPVTIVTGQAGKIIVPVMRIIEASTTTFGDTGLSWVTQYTDEPNITIFANQVTDFNNVQDKYVVTAAQALNAVGSNTDGIVGSSVNITLTADVTSGVHTASVTYLYFVVDANILT